MTDKYIHRPLADQVCRSHRKVVVIEGARAVGKTMLAQTELVNKRNYHYVTLADNLTYHDALRNVDDWLSRLPRPIVIDEAQRIGGLPLAIKGIVDASNASAPQFILTGSASITRTGLDGQDPLTRRSQRFTLSPMTVREINRNADTSIVDILWDANPNLEWTTDNSREDLFARMKVGGFPNYAISQTIMSDSERRLYIRDDIENTLGDTILPEEQFNKSLAQDLLNELLCIPGRVLNVSALASTLNRDKRTIQRYISIFMRRFLLTYLPNLALTGQKQTLTRAKIHPIDTSLSVEAIRRSGKDPLGDPVIFGMLFESFVVNQIVPEVQWSQIHPDLFFWRTSGKEAHEVDLVLVHDNELIGIEVKSSGRLHQGDFKGLEALKNKDPRFRKGFIVYTGNKILQHSSDMWAIPVSALWEKGAFAMEKETTALNAIPQAATILETERMTDANLFLSYSHADNDFLDGKIVDLARTIAESYRFITGHDVSLFIDSESINWGDDWRRALRSSVDATNFFMPAVTPNYLNSKAFREEYLQFETQLSETSQKKILPLMWQRIPNLDQNSTDPVLNSIKRTQWLDVDSLQDLMPSSPEYKKQARVIARKLQEIINANRKALETSIQKPSTKITQPQKSHDDLIHQFGNIERALPKMNQSVNTMTSSMTSIVETLNDNPMPADASAQQMIQWSEDISRKIDPRVSTLNDSITMLGNQWHTVSDAMRTYKSLIMQMPDGDEKRSAQEQCDSALQSIVLSLTMSGNIREQLGLMRMIGNMVFALRPMSQAFENTFNLMDSIRTTAQELLDLGH